MLFEWDPAKDKINIDKHGVSFQEAEEVFGDPLHISFLDDRFSYFEERWITMGQTQNGGILVVAHLYTVGLDDETIRIISARKATGKEKNQYETIERRF